MSNKPPVRRISSEQLETRVLLAGDGMQHLIGTPELPGVVADLNGDDLPDLVGASGWKPNDGNGNFGPWVEFDVSGSNSQTRALDFDGDGDLDLMLGFEHFLENVDGRGSFVKRDSLVIDRGALIPVDLDSDGDLDLTKSVYFRGPDGSYSVELIWHENIGGLRFDSPTFVAEVDDAAVWWVDINDDGDVDILAKADGPLRWFQRDRAGNYSERPIEVDSELRIYEFVDLDTDGDLDILGRLEGKVVWLANDGSGNLTPATELADEDCTPHTITTNSTSDGCSVRPVSLDVDGDNDPDVVLLYDLAIGGDWQTPYREARFLINQGNEVFNGETVASLSLGYDTYSGSEQINWADVDGDGDLDALLSNGFCAYYYQICSDETAAAAGADHRASRHIMRWFRNEGQQFELVGHVSGAGGVQALADFDGDGDLDLLSHEEHQSGAELAWFENTDGLGNFEQHSVVGLSGTDRMLAVDDIDGDGDTDVVAVGEFRPVWYENTDGRGTFRLHTIPFGTLEYQNRYAFNEVRLHDHDGDGDLDLLLSSYIGAQSFWLENADGQGTFAEAASIPEVPSTPEFTWEPVATVDIDGDGDLDEVRLDGGLAWYENQCRILGDASGDGVFDSSDLVLVFAASEYEDDISGNSTFEEGDWNGDGEFDSSDLVAAMQTGHYIPAALPLDVSRPHDAISRAARDAIFAMAVREKDDRDATIATSEWKLLW